MESLSLTSGCIVATLIVYTTVSHDTCFSSCNSEPAILSMSVNLRIAKVHYRSLGRLPTRARCLHSRERCCVGLVPEGLVYRSPPHFMVFTHIQALAEQCGIAARVMSAGKAALLTACKYYSLYWNCPHRPVVDVSYHLHNYHVMCQSSCSV